MLNIHVKKNKCWLIPIIIGIMLVSIYILYRYSQEIQVAQNFLVAESFCSNDQIVLTMAGLDRVVFRFTLSSPDQSVDDMYLKLQCLNSDQNYSLKFLRKTNMNQYYYHYVGFTTVEDKHDYVKVPYLEPGKYLVSIGFNDHERIEKIKGRLVLGYFCRYKRIHHYKQNHQTIIDYQVAAVLSINSSAAKFPFLRREETISAGNFIGRSRLQTMNLAPIVPSFSLNSGILTQKGLRRKVG
ncbi:MAG: hypothetical protein BWX73_01155 [Lentisphaerae bacterium ADurb.Bin082]|nr:MAG: hypothetical protein BWX73_01155 [Lentisphaerae bacterium ADurb.Bin082]